MKVLISLRPLSIFSIRKESEKYDVVVCGIWEDVGECSEKTEMNIIVRNQEIASQIKKILCDGGDGGFNLKEESPELVKKIFYDSEPEKANKKFTLIKERMIVFYVDGDISIIDSLIDSLLKTTAEVVYA